MPHCSSFPSLPAAAPDTNSQLHIFIPAWSVQKMSLDRVKPMHDFQFSPLGLDPCYLGPVECGRTPGRHSSPCAKLRAGVDSRHHRRHRRHNVAKHALPHCLDIRRRKKKQTRTSSGVRRASDHVAPRGRRGAMEFVSLRNQ